MNKKIYLTESELRSVIKRVIEEQPDNFGGRYNPVGYKPKVIEVDEHTRNMILGIGLAFVPYVGPLLSAGIGLADAKLYMDEGDKYTAGLVGMFSLLPGAGLLGKLGLGKWTAETLIPIARKIKLGQKLFPAEAEVVKKITQNKQLIQNELKKYGDITLQQAKQKAKQTATKQAIKKIPGWAGKNIVAPTVAYDVGYNQAFKNDIKVKVENQGLDWDEVKNAFGSSGTKKDNELLTKAWDNGWRPGMDIPENLKTPSSKVERENDVANLEKLKEKLK